MASILTLVGMGIIFFYSKETKATTPLTFEKKPFFRSAFTVFRMPNLKRLYCANFFLALGFFSFFRFFPVYLERRFDFSSTKLAYVIAYNSVAFAFSLLFFIKPLTRYFTAHKTTALFATLLALFFVVAILPASPNAFLWTVPPIGICLAIVITYGSVMISNEAESHFQGQAMGNLQSVQVLAEVITGVLGGVLATLTSYLPLLVGGAMAVICSLILITRKGYSLENEPKT
jgi:predicted MFS family arabinose efflux permease